MPGGYQHKQTYLSEAFGTVYQHVAYVCVRSVHVNTVGHKRNLTRDPLSSKEWRRATWWV